jgi:pimeloyl-ACP methyl ester carboxylesterase
MERYTLTDIVTSYLTSVRKHQPSGPYHLGGWSAGGILAYAVALELMAQGEEIASLMFIDSPPPTKGLDRLPERFFDHCSSVGIFGSELIGDSGPTAAPTKIPNWLMPHFRATIEMLHHYVAPPMSPSPGQKMPKVTLVWAGSSPFDGDRYAAMPTATAANGGQDTEGMKFLTKAREDFGPGEWAHLFPGSSIDVHVMEGEHHFSMMRGEGAEKLAGMIKGAI